MSQITRDLRYWLQGLTRNAADALPVRVGGREYSRVTVTPARRLGFDHALVGVAVTLLLWGLVMVYSTTIALPDSPRYANYTQSHFLQRHLLSLGIGLLAAGLVFLVPLALWEKLAPWLFVLSLLLLVVVLIPHVGKVVNRARRWLPLGIMNFQPSELVKLTVLLYASDYMVRKFEVREDFFRAVTPMVAAVGLVGVLLLAEPDMGAFLVIAVIAVGILFLGGVNASMMALISGVMLVVFALMIGLNDTRRERIFAFLDPWSEKNALGKGYQLTHSLIAIGRGEWFRRQRGEAGLAARGPYRLHASGHRRGVRPGWGTRRAAAFSVAHTAHHGHWPPSDCAGAPVLRLGRARGRDLDRLSSLRQHRRELGCAAHQGPDPAADELWRISAAGQSGGTGFGAARRF